MGVLNEEKPKTPSGKKKIKTPLTRPASLEMTHYLERWSVDKVGRLPY
jgi:hypothetical protein